MSGRAKKFDSNSRVWRGPASEIDRSGDPYVEQFINGRAQGPITGED